LNLPHVATLVSIDDSPFVSSYFPGGWVLSRGNQSMTVALDMLFSRTAESQATVKAFLSDLYSKGWGQTTQNIVASDVRFGYSDTDYIKSFRKMKVAITTRDIFSKGTWSYLLNQLGLQNGVDDLADAAATLARIDIQRGILDFEKIPGAISIDAAAHLSGTKFDFNLVIPVFEFDFGVDGISFGKARFRDLRLNPVPEAGGVIGTTLTVEFFINATPQVKRRMAQAITEMQAGQRPTGLMTGTNFVIGVSDDDQIGIFKTLLGELFVYHVATPGTGLFNSLLGTLNLDDVMVGVGSADVLDITVKTSMNSPLRNIRSKVPYLFMEAQIDGQRLATLESTEVEFIDGITNANVSVTFHQDQRVEIQKMVDLVTNVLFRRKQEVFPVITITKLRFGHSKEKAITFVDEGVMVYNIQRLITLGFEYVTTPGQELELTDIHTVSTPQGVSCRVTGTRLPPLLPFRSKPGAGGLAKVLWAPNDK
ncbi:hypothetical protein HDV05_001802, partial [Chytridiales sp. JEL 0842]